VAVTGDDVLILRRTEAGMVIYSKDAKRHDMHVHGGCFRSIREIKRYLKLEVADHMYDSATRRVYHIAASESYGRAEVDFTMGSGQGDTITGNSLIYIHLVLLWVTFDFPPLERMFSLYGFLVEGYEAVFSWDRVTDFDFLQKIFLFNDLGEVVPAPKPGRILARLFWSPEKRSEHHMKKYCYQVALGVYHDAAHVPLINDICLNIFAQFPNFSGVDPIMEKYAIHTSAVHVEGHQNLGLLASRYSLSDLELNSLRQRLRNWKWGEFLDDNATRSCFEAIVSIDCN